MCSVEEASGYAKARTGCIGEIGSVNAVSLVVDAVVRSGGDSAHAKGHGATPTFGNKRLRGASPTTTSPLPQDINTIT